MRKVKVEKQIINIDKDIEALTRTKKYLSNAEEIETVKKTLNRERQLLVHELYAEEGKARMQCAAVIETLLDKTLEKEAQLELLEQIKEIFGRRAPDVSKSSNGLNAWLNELGATCEWTQNQGADWASLVITTISAMPTK